VAPIDDEEHLLFSCESTKDIRLRFAGLPMSNLRDLMQCEDVGNVAWFVHECMGRVDNSHTGRVEDNNVTIIERNTQTKHLITHPTITPAQASHQVSLQTQPRTSSLSLKCQRVAPCIAAAAVAATSGTGRNPAQYLQRSENLGSD
jgi:hypothetical protein